MCSWEPVPEAALLERCQLCDGKWSWWRTGITDKTEGGPFLLEARQGDTISGNVSRQELARLVVAALATPEATGTQYGPAAHWTSSTYAYAHAAAPLLHWQC